MPERLLVWGGGGHGKVVADLARACGHHVVGFIDADPDKVSSAVEPGGAVVLMTEQEFVEGLSERDLPGGATGVLLAIGDNSARRARFHRLEGSNVPALTHPAAVTSPSTHLGQGTVVMAGAVLNAAARIGRAAIVNTSAVVEHDCIVADAAHLSPGCVLAGGVQVGVEAWIGAGAVVLPGVRVGDGAIVGAGAVVLHHVPAGATVVGNPALPVGSTREKPRL